MNAALLTESLEVIKQTASVILKALEQTIEKPGEDTTPEPQSENAA